MQGLPTLVLFFKGEEIWRNEGVILGKDIVEMLNGLQDEGRWEQKKEMWDSV